MLHNSEDQEVLIKSTVRIYSGLLALRMVYRVCIETPNNHWSWFRARERQTDRSALANLMFCWGGAIRHPDMEVAFRFQVCDSEIMREQLPWSCVRYVLELGGCLWVWWVLSLTSNRCSQRYGWLKKVEKRERLVEVTETRLLDSLGSSVVGLWWSKVEGDIKIRR